VESGHCRGGDGNVQSRVFERGFGLDDGQGLQDEYGDILYDDGYEFQLL